MQVLRVDAGARRTDSVTRGLDDALLASGGVANGSELDFASGYPRHVHGFLRITQVEIIAAAQLNRRGQDGIARARQAVKHLFADTLPDNNAAA